MGEDFSDYVTFTLPLAFEELLDAMREKGAEVTLYIIPEEGVAVEVAND